MKTSKPLDLYMAFPDGAYHYVCAECTALCCRGHGLGGSIARELGPVFERFPAMQLTVIARRGDQIDVSTPPTGCLLVRHDNFCGVETALGREYKPSVCKLFPFNGFFRVGPAVAVAPHFLCPLRVHAPSRPGEVAGTHAVLEPAIRESGFVEANLSVFTRVPLRQSQEVADVLAVEEAFRDACAAALGRESFAEVLRGASSDPAALDEAVARGARLMGLEPLRPSSPPDDFDALLLALAPPVRLKLLLLEPEGMLRALALGEVMLRRLWEVSGGVPTPQAAYTMLDETIQVLFLLGHGDEPLGVPEGFGGKLPAFQDAALVFATFAATRELGRGAGTLGALERAMGPSLPGYDRSVLLRHVGNAAMRVREKASKGRGKR
jgi:hypothetical protein